MRSLALLAFLGVALGALNYQQLSVPGASSDLSIPLMGNPNSWWGTVSTDAAASASKSFTSSNLGQNVYFRVGAYNASNDAVQTLKISISGDKQKSCEYLLGHQVCTSVGTKFTVTSSSFSYDGNDNVTQLIAVSSDLLEQLSSDGTTWTFTITQTAGSGTTKFFADLMYYGSVIKSSQVGTEGAEGPKYTAVIPCCTSTDSSYMIAMNQRDHQFLQVTATEVMGPIETLKLTNPTSLYVDTDNFDVNKNYAGQTQVRTCISNQSCGTIVASYYVHLVTHGQNDNLDPKDYVATFTLTTKAGVASASATLAVVLAALFALFH